MKNVMFSYLFLTWERQAKNFFMKKPQNTKTVKNQKNIKILLDKFYINDKNKCILILRLYLILDSMANTIKKRTKRI